MKNNIFIIYFFLFYFFFFHVSANEKAFIRLEDKTKFIVDLAISSEEKKRGLMNINKLVNTNGMLFLYKKERVVNMWMKNTHLDLAIIFINTSKQILDIKVGFKFSKKIISSNQPVIAILEIPSFCSKKLKLNIGDYLDWEIINYQDFKKIVKGKETVKFPCVK